MPDSRGRLLVVDDEPSLRETLDIALRRAGHTVRCAASAPEALEALAASSFDLVITDVRMPDMSGIDLLARIKAVDPAVEVIVATAFARAEDAVEVMKAGAYDYIIKPFNLEELRVLVERALERRQLGFENARLRAALAARQVSGFKAWSPAMRTVAELVGKVAVVDSTVLITGESGVGKEVVAKDIHARSPRCDGPFVAVNCGALPEHLVEAELFGHERGAFTGAERARPGLLEQAHGGTLFLDEIAELPLAAQVKLLRVLQEQRVRRLGSEQEQQLDVRFIAATNRSLEAEVRAGRFREDLFFRLNVVRIEIPPLRERPEDIRELARQLAAEAGARLGVVVDEVEPAVLDQLCRYDFPGNVRELQNLIERAVILSGGGRLTIDTLPRDLREQGPEPPSPGEELPENFSIDDYLAGIERDLIERAISESGGVKTRAAERLGLSFRQFRYKAKKYGL